MRTLHLLCATALTAVTFSTAPVVAAENNNAKKTEVIKVEKGAKLEMMDIEGKKTFLETLYDAQVALHNKKSKQAQNYIQAAMDQLGKIREVDVTTKSQEKVAQDGAKKTNMDADDRVNSAAKNNDKAAHEKDDYVPSKHPVKVESDKVETTKNKKEVYNDSYKGRKVLEVQFGSTIMPEKAVMPIANGNVTNGAIKQALTIEGLKKGEIKDVKIRYITMKMDKKAARDQLIEARKELESEDFYGAQYDLLQIQRSMLEDGDDNIPAQTRARDNIALTRYLVKSEDYDAARETLDQAEDAIDDMEEASKTKNQALASNVVKIKREIESLDDVIKKRDPSMFDKIDEKLETWWNELS